jgi:hypothetical protein
VRVAGPAQEPIVCADDLYEGGAAALLAECEARGMGLADMAADLEGQRIGVGPDKVGWGPVRARMWVVGGEVRARMWVMGLAHG